MKLSELFNKICKEKSYSEKQEDEVNALDTSQTWFNKADSGSYTNIPYETTTTSTSTNTPNTYIQPTTGNIYNGWEGLLGSFAKKASKILAKIGFIRYDKEGKFGLKIDCSIEIDDKDVGLSEDAEKVVNEYFNKLSEEITNEIIWRKSLAMLLISGEKQKNNKE